MPPSPRVPRALAARPSPYSAGVTLFETLSDVAADALPAAAAPRRSPRKRALQTHTDASESDLTDLEDLVFSPAKRTVTTTTRKRVQARPADGGADGAFAIAQTTRTRASASPVKRSPAKTHRAASGSPTKRRRVELVLPEGSPARWEETYAAIQSMRTRLVAPVDEMGCQMAGQGETDPKNKRLATLVSLILSPQTKDEVCDAAVRKLRAALGGAISLEALLAAEEETIQEAIRKVGFWPKKTRFLKESAEMLRDQFDGDVPRTIKELVELPGVGPKVGFLTLQFAWNINTGIGVDVHVHRITNLLGWQATSEPEQTRKCLESWLPKDKWRDINHMLVGFGQTICTPEGPRCDQCDLSVKGLCPSARKVVTTSRKSRALGKAGTAQVAVVVEEEKVVLVEPRTDLEGDDDA